MEIRKQLALEAFQHTATYDMAIADELHSRFVGRPQDSDITEEQNQRLPSILLSASIKSHNLRYGENAHQAAALYMDPKEIGQHKSLGTARVEGGKAMSYNNYTDADATLRLCRALSTDEWPQTPHACVIV